MQLSVYISCFNSFYFFHVSSFPFHDPSSSPSLSAMISFIGFICPSPQELVAAPPPGQGLQP